MSKEVIVELHTVAGDVYPTLPTDINDIRLRDMLAAALLTTTNIQRIEILYDGHIIRTISVEDNEHYPIADLLIREGPL